MVGGMILVLALIQLGTMTAISISVGGFLFLVYRLESHNIKMITGRKHVS